jgi:hypothetical protein
MRECWTPDYKCWLERVGSVEVKVRQIALATFQMNE